MPDPRRRSAAAMLCLLLAFVAPPSGAEVCDDIDALSEGWLGVADTVEENAGDEVAELDVERLETDVNALLQPTETVGNGLVELGTAGEEALGRKLLAFVEELREVEGGDLPVHLVDRIDDLVGTLDGIIAYCDEVGG